MKLPRTVLAVAALALSASALPTAAAQTEAPSATSEAESTPESPEGADQGDAEDDAVSTECKPLTVLVPTPSNTDAKLPTQTASGIFSEVTGQALADEDAQASITPIYIPYKAKGNGEAGEVYSDTLTDGYARLTQIAYRVTQQCPTGKLALLGQGQAGHLVSFFASEVGAGNSPVREEDVAFAATISDPTRAPGAELFPGAPGVSAPEGWGKTDQVGMSTWSREKNDEPATSVSLFADLAKVPEGSGLNHKSQQISDFGTLTGRVAQFCVDGDLSCSAPNNAALGRAALTITEQAGADFTKDPIGAANLTSQAMSATAASGVAKSAGQDWEGDSLSNLAPTGEHSVSERIEQAATQGIRPSTTGKNSDTDDEATSAFEDSMTALVRGGSIGITSLATVAGDVLDADTISSLMAAGVTGGATSPELTATLTAKAGQSALKLIEPASLGERATKVFTAMTNNLVDNEELPDLIASARTWDQLTTQDGYKVVPIASTGETVTEVLADWTIAAARDHSAALEPAEETTSATASSEANAPTTTDAPAPKEPADQGNSEAEATSSPAAQPMPPMDYAASAPGESVGVDPLSPYTLTDEGDVLPASNPVSTDAETGYALYTTDAQASDQNWAANPQTIAEAQKGMVTGNADFTAAERLAFLADPAYPDKSALKQIAVSGGLIPVTHSRGGANV